MKFPKYLFCLMVLFCTASVQAQGPIRQFLQNRQPVRTAIKATAVVVSAPVKAVVSVQPVRSVFKTVTGNRSYGCTGSVSSYGSTGSSYSYGSSGTSYSYGSLGTSVSYGSTGKFYGSTGSYVVARPVTTSSCPCGPNCQCDVGGTPCPCPKTTADCVDCKTKGNEPPKIVPTAPVAMEASPEPPALTAEESKDNFHAAVVQSVREAQKNGEISRFQALAIRGAMHFPSFKERVKETAIAKAKETGKLSVNATPDEVGKIDWSSIDWAAIIKMIIPIIIMFL